VTFFYVYALQVIQPTYITGDSAQLARSTALRQSADIHVPYLRREKCN